MKRLKNLIIVLIVTLIATSGILVKEVYDNRDKQKNIDETFKACYISILNSMHSTLTTDLGEEAKSKLTARDTGYGHIMRSTYLSTSYAVNQDFLMICDLLDDSTGTDAVYSIHSSEELYHSLLTVYEDDFADAELMKETVEHLQKSIDK